MENEFDIDDEVTVFDIGINGIVTKIASEYITVAFEYDGVGYEIDVDPNEVTPYIVE